MEAIIDPALLMASLGWYMIGYIATMWKPLNVFAGTGKFRPIKIAAISLALAIIFFGIFGDKEAITNYIGGYI